MKPEEYSERELQIDGWSVHLVSYRLNGTWHCQADNVSPGASLARVRADTREAAEEQALARAKELLSRTRRRAV